MAVTAAAAIIGAGVGVYKILNGQSKENEAKNARARLANPFYAIQDEYYQNRNLANSMAQGGLPAATKDYYTNQSERGLSAGISAITGSGGSPNDISKIFQTYNDGIGKISAVDAEMHLNNIKYYMGVNKDLAGQKTIQWGLNVKQPHDNTLKELSGAQKAGEATKWEGVSDTLSSISSFGTAMSNSNLMKPQNKNVYQLPALTTSVMDSPKPELARTTGTGRQEISDPFSNNDKDYQEYLDYIKRQHGE